MSKELEALKNIINEISNYKLHGLGDENWLGIQDVIQDIDTLEKALTPPTEEEVCEALSEYYGVEVKHNNYEHDDINESFMRDAFYKVRIKEDMDGTKYKVKHDIVAGGKDGLSFNAWLPAHLITLIGKFYENEVNKDV